MLLGFRASLISCVVFYGCVLGFYSCVSCTEYIASFLDGIYYCRNTRKESFIKLRSLQRLIKSDTVRQFTVRYEPLEVFWVDDDVKLLRYSFATGESQTLIYLNDDVFGITLDWISNNLYWTYRHFVMVLSLRTNKETTLYKTSVHAQLLDILVDPLPSARYLFWTEQSLDAHVARVVRASLDGRNTVSLTEKAFSKINPIHILADLSLRMLFWADRRNRRIVATSYDGEQNYVIVENVTVQALWSSDQRIKYTDTTGVVRDYHYITGCVRGPFQGCMIHRDSQNVYEILVKHNLLHKMISMDASMQRKGADPCSSDACDTVCIVRSDGQPMCCAEKKAVGCYSRILDSNNIDSQQP